VYKSNSSHHHFFNSDWAQKGMIRVIFPSTHKKFQAYSFKSACPQFLSPNRLFPLEEIHKQQPIYIIAAIRAPLYQTVQPYLCIVFPPALPPGSSQENVLDDGSASDPHLDKTHFRESNRSLYDNYS
jgi:hypothetical protein